MDTQHLHSLELALSKEKSRLSAATMQAEREMRKVWVAQLEREIAAERKFLGLPEAVELPELTNDELAKLLEE